MFVPRPQQARVTAVRRRAGAVVVTLGGRGLRSWRSTGLPDEWVHLWVPSGPGSAPDDPRRLYSVRSVDPVELELSRHSRGPAAAWAARVQVGWAVRVSQPTGRHRPPRTAGFELVVADHAGLPAARRILATAPPGRRLLAVLEVDGPAVPLPDSRPGVEVRVLHRPELERPSGLPGAVAGNLAAVEAAGPDGYLWLGAEAVVARAVRRLLRGRGWPAQRYAVAGYWQRRDPGYPGRYAPVAARIARLYAEVEQGIRDPEAVADDLDDLLDTHDL